MDSRKRMAQPNPRLARSTRARTYHGQHDEQSPRPGHRTAGGRPQAALLRALQSGRIAGAALDVTDSEPLDAADALCTLPNVVLTPHIASGTIETRRAMHELAVRNLLQAMAGEIPDAAVNPQVLQAR